MNSSNIEPVPYGKSFVFVTREQIKAKHDLNVSWIGFCYVYVFCTNPKWLPPVDKISIKFETLLRNPVWFCTKYSCCAEMSIYL